MMSSSNVTVCPICHLGVLSTAYQATALDYSIEQYYPITICSHCGYGKTNNTEPQTTDLYVGGCYDTQEKPWHQFIQPLLSKLEKGKLNYLNNKDDITAKKILEIGCGKGRFLAAAKQQGYQVYGIEPSPRSFAFASATLGDAVASIGLEELDNNASFPKKYNYVMLWHVLEHLDNPRIVLAQLKKKLLADGKIIIAVPNFASFQARLGKSDWYHLDPPRHLHHFTPESMRILAEEEGLYIDALVFNSFYQNFVGELITLTNKILPAKNIIFNSLRLNTAYLTRLGKTKAWSLFILASVISALLLFPVFILTLYNQFSAQSGTMVISLKNK